MGAGGRYTRGSRTNFWGQVMRALIATVAALAALAGTGCYHDKYDVGVPKKEEYIMPPDEARYSQPDTAIYRPKSQERQQETLLNSRNRQNLPGGPGGPGGF